MRLHQKMMRTHQNTKPALVALAALAVVALQAGCDGGVTQACRGDRDCASGVCVNGACRPLTGAPDLSAGDDGAPAGGDGSTNDLRPAPLPDGANTNLDALAASCAFNNDGVITRAEAPFVIGLGALYAVNPAGSTVPVSTVPGASGWDYTAPVTNETKVFDQLLAPSGQWWSGDFPDATYAERLQDGQNVLGVYRVSADQLELLGLVSDTSGLQQTSLKYATAIPVLKFPLALNDHWSAESDLTGTLNGFLFTAHDNYDLTVDRRATTKVPAGTFDTLRVRINYKQTIGFSVTTKITYLHLAECYGAVARLRSQDNEPSNDFTQAAEYRRLATQ
jgi:hypothetical protein